MGQHRECEICVDYSEKLDMKIMDDFLKEVKEKLPECDIKEEDHVFLFTSQREVNLQYQLNLFEGILGDYKEIIERAEGSVFLQTDYFSFVPGEEEE